MTTQYYGAEIQDVQVQFEVRLNNRGSTTLGGQIVTTFVFNQKVLADTYTLKSTQPSNKPVPLSTTNIVLNYTPIILQRGKGGPVVNDPIALIESFYPNYKFESFNESNLKYDSRNLTKVQSITGISTSAAADLIEVAATYSIIVSAPTIIMNGLK
jgi:hypothetical protein